jgi:hypothetical protein
MKLEQREVNIVAVERALISGLTVTLSLAVAHSSMMSKLLETVSVNH